uniref:Retrotransposon protein, putative, unclassified n=1 Tax=Tanacetum cinerariifolium TaxID=118510 RepID=A0A6L2J608_TANCI|nr:retrotransposon protein, putative, unclassified [Tanacetum cinerariifolium]
MFLYVEQLKKQLDKEDFQKIGSMKAFNVLDTRFQMFITNRDYLKDEYVAMTRSYFIQYTGQAILEFRDTLIQHLESVKKLIDERVQLKREYDGWVNERLMQTTKEKVDTSKALDASSVDTISSRTESKEQDTSSRSGKDAHDDDADIRPIYDEEPKAEIPEHSYQSLEYENSCLKKTVAQFQKDFSRLEAHCVNLELKYQNQVLNKGKHSQFLKEKSNKAKVKHDISVIETINIKLEHKVAKLLKENESLKKNYKELFDSIKITRAKTTEHKTSLIATNDKFKAQLQKKGKPMSQPLRNQSVVRQPTAFKSKQPRFSKPRYDSQVDVHNDLSKPVTTHYLPKERKAASVKSHHMIAPSNSRISSKNMTKPSLIPSARLQSTTNGSKPMPRRNTQTSRNWPAFKNSFVMTKTVPVAEHPRNSRNDSCVTKFLKEVNSRAKVPFNKTTNSCKPIEQISVSNIQARQIPKGHRFSLQKTSVVQKKTMIPRSCLRWKPTETSVANNTSGLVPQRQKASDYDNPDPVPQRKDVYSLADADVPSQQELDLLFGPLYDEFFNAGSNPSTNIRSTSAPSTHTNVHAEEKNDQAEEGEQLQDDEFTNPFCAPAQEEAESSLHNLGNSNVPTLNQPQVSEYRWMKDHPLEQVRGNPQTRQQLATDPEMYMYALTVSTAEPKNIKEAMADSAWIEAMQEKLHQFDRLQQAPRAWYDELSKFLTSKGFTKGLQIHQSPRGIFINQAKYTLDILHKHGMDQGQIIGTPMATKPKLDADLSGNPLDQTDYRNADHAGCIDSRKSTSGGIQFLGDKLVSWMLKKQNYTAMSSAEAEYVALSTSYMFTKALPDDRFKYLVRRIGMRCLTPAELEVLAKEYA